MALTKPASGDPGYSGATKASVVIGAIVDKLNQSPINVKEAAYGAVGGGSTNDTAAFQAAHDALSSTGSVIYAPADTYKVQGLNWTTNNVTIQGAGINRTILKTSSGALLNLGASASNLAGVTFKDLTLWSASGGGDVVAAGMAAGKVLSGCSFQNVAFQQDNTAGKIWNWDGPGIVDTVFSGCQFQHSTSGSVSPMYFRSANGDQNTVLFVNRCKATNCGQPFFYVESTAAATYAYDWHWEDFTGEVLVGGFLKGLGMFMPRLVKVGNYDMAVSGSSLFDWILLGAGSGGAKTRKFHIEHLLRANGSLGAGLNDISLNATGDVIEGHIANCDTATVAGVTIDLKTNHGILITNCVSSTISNRTTTTAQIHTPSSSRAIIRLSTNPTDIQTGAGSPETVITATVGSLWLRTDGGAGTTLYVKETGTGNTGWAAK